ncbi:MAG: ATP-binding protein, partial [Rubrobacteraceae bacterium]
TGSGGCGKTRHALEVARDLAEAYPDGRWLVELSSLSEPGLVLRTVAGVVGARERPDRPLVETVCRHLRGKRTLLVLDNCEHLVDACADVADGLLGACPDLRVLATSREPLGVSGEALWPVSPLSVPQSEREDPRSYEAVRLFLDRARSRLPAFDLTPANERVVAEVCRRLDGIPLAIELAAARTAALAVEQVAERLSASLGLLTGGSRAADSRHRTLRATLDWSHRLLDEPERGLFERLSVFAGGWTLEAAEAVGTDASAVPGLLASLVDKSLVVAETGGAGASRYRMLETVRQYAGELLEAGGEVERVRERHAGHYRAFAERAEPEISGSRQVAWLERLEAEHGNLRAALSWFLAGGYVEENVRLAAALGRFWNAHGFAEGGEWLDRGLERGGDVSSAVRAKALRESGRIALFRGQHAKAVSRLEEGLELYRRLGDGDGIAATLANLGFVMAHAGQSERVAALREEAETIRRQPLDRHALAHLLTFLGLAALSEWDPDRAAGPLEESLALSRELQDARDIVVSLIGLGMTALGQSDHERAATLFEESLSLLREQGDRPGIAYALLGLAGVAAARGQPIRAARLWGAAEALREAVGIPLSPFDRAHYEYERRISDARSTLDTEAWSAAWAEGRAMTPEQAIEYALSKREEREPPTLVAVPEQRPPADEPTGTLTRRERGVALCVARG